MFQLCFFFGNALPPPFPSHFPAHPNLTLKQVHAPLGCTTEVREGKRTKSSLVVEPSSPCRPSFFSCFSWCAVVLPNENNSHWVFKAVLELRGSFLKPQESSSSSDVIEAGFQQGTSLLKWVVCTNAHRARLLKPFAKLSFPFPAPCPKLQAPALFCQGCLESKSPGKASIGGSRLCGFL